MAVNNLGQVFNIDITKKHLYSINFCYLFLLKKSEGYDNDAIT